MPVKSFSTSEVTYWTQRKMSVTTGDQIHLVSRYTKVGGHASHVLLQQARYA